MEIECPYSKLELIVCLRTINEKKLIEKCEQEIARHEKVEQELKPLNRDFSKRIAEYHGITIEQLTNSPNYQILCNKYQEHCVLKLIKMIEVQMDLSKKQAWALYAKVRGFLDD